MGATITSYEYEGKKVYSIQQMNALLNKSNAVSKFRTNHNKNLKEGIDYITVPKKVYTEITKEELKPNSNYFFITETMKGKMLHVIPIDPEKGTTQLRKNMRKHLSDMNYIPEIVEDAESIETIEEEQEPVVEEIEVEQESTEPVSESKEIKLNDIDFFSNEGNELRPLAMDFLPATEPAEEIEKVEEEEPIILPKPKRKYTRKKKIEEKVEPFTPLLKVNPVEEKITVEQQAQIQVTCDINKLVSDFMSIASQQYEIQAKQIEAQSRQITELSQMLREMINYKMKQPTLAPTKQEEYPDYETYKKQINKAVDKIVDLQTSLYPTKSGILSEAYKALTRDYGIVWEQSKKDFNEVYERGPVNTIELCWFIEQDSIYRNLLLAKLNNMYEEAKKEAEKTNEYRWKRYY